ASSYYSIVFRYQDVPCQDQSRVVITWPGAAIDYIHANYVGTPLSDKRFICTQVFRLFIHSLQGPLDGTITEFWQMVLQEESQTIVMLCNCIELELLSRVRGTNKPIIVHCSAGIGRTGTVVAIEYILERMQAGVECAAMNDLLKELRNQRAYTIQNDLQYLFIHRVMLCYFLEKHRQRYESLLTEEVQAKYKKFVEDYNQATGTN
ncbi:Protein-tyrosine phosphatase, partial [Ostertagia ostertagi]